MKLQGDRAELMFMLYCQEKGYIISKPFGDNAKYDLIVDDGVTLNRVQIKSTSRKDTGKRTDCYNCLVCSGCNSKTKYTKKDVDEIAIYVIPEKTWYRIPVEQVTGKTVKLYPHRESCSHKYEVYKVA